jgi:hypothetical protein
VARVGVLRVGVDVARVVGEVVGVAGGRVAVRVVVGEAAFVGDPDALAWATRTVGKAVGVGGTTVGVGVGGSTGLPGSVQADRAIVRLSSIAQSAATKRFGRDLARLVRFFKRPSLGAESASLHIRADDAGRYLQSKRQHPRKCYRAPRPEARAYPSRSSASAQARRAR